MRTGTVRAYAVVHDGCAVRPKVNEPKDDAQPLLLRASLGYLERTLPGTC